MCFSASAGGTTAWGTSGGSERNATERLAEGSVHPHCSRLELYIGFVTPLIISVKFITFLNSNFNSFLRRVYSD